MYWIIQPLLECGHLVWLLYMKSCSIKLKKELKKNPTPLHLHCRQIQAISFQNSVGILCLNIRWTISTEVRLVDISKTDHPSAVQCRIKELVSGRSILVHQYCQYKIQLQHKRKKRILQLTTNDDSKHTPKGAQKKFKDNKLDVLQRPSQSSDLDPIQILWLFRPDPRAPWQSVQMFHQWLHHRLRAVTAAKGGLTNTEQKVH